MRAKWCAQNAEMSEWPKEHDWKSCVPRKGTEGSNPSLCAKKIRERKFLLRIFLWHDFVTLSALKTFKTYNW